MRQPCLELALAAAGSYAEDHGIYGGLTPRERLAVRRRRAAAPARHRPKVPAVAWTAARRDRAEATRAFALAERVGINEAARRLQISTASLYRAWRHWGLGRPDSSGSVARRQRQLESGEGRRRAFRHLERQRLRTSAAAGLPPGQPAASLPPADQVA